MKDQRSHGDTKVYHNVLIYLQCLRGPKIKQYFITIYEHVPKKLLRWIEFLWGGMKINMNQNEW